MEQEILVNAERRAGGSGGFGQALALLARGRHRLLQQHVAARFEQRHGNGGMGVGRRQHMGGVKAAGRQGLVSRADRLGARQQTRKLFGGRAARIGHRYHGDARHLAQHFGMDAGNVSGPNQTDASHGRALRLEGVTARPPTCTAAIKIRPRR